MTKTVTSQNKSSRPIIDTKQPTVFYEAPTRLQTGKLSHAVGTLVLTSKSIAFIDDMHHKRFDIDLHAIHDLYFWRNNFVFEITHRRNRYVLKPGLQNNRYRVLCGVGFVLGVIPGLIVYHFWVDPERTRNRQLTKKLKKTMSHHAIRIDD